MGNFYPFLGNKKESWKVKNSYQVLAILKYKKNLIY